VLATAPPAVRVAEAVEGPIEAALARARRERSVRIDFRGLEQHLPRVRRPSVRLQRHAEEV
jgi:hypothetical protein